MARSTQRRYTEFVLITVFSYVAATSWRSVLSQLLDRYAPESILADVLVATATTLLAVVVLTRLFPRTRRELVTPPGDTRHEEDAQGGEKCVSS